MREEQHVKGEICVPRNGSTSLRCRDPTSREMFLGKVTRIHNDVSLRARVVEMSAICCAHEIVTPNIQEKHEQRVYETCS